MTGFAQRDLERAERLLRNLRRQLNPRPDRLPLRSAQERRLYIKLRAQGVARPDALRAIGY